MIRRRQLLGLAGAPLMLSPFAVLGGCRGRLDTDVAIVGSGPAGLALADSLAQQGRTVLVIDGGGRQPDPARQALHTVEAGAHGLPYNIGWASQRVLGGTTNLWESHSPRPWAEELASRSLRDYGEDWPLDLATLTPFLAEAERWLRVRPADPATNPAMPHNPYIASSAALRQHLQASGYQALEAGAYGMVDGDDRDALNLLADGEVDRIASATAVTLLPQTDVRRLKFSGRKVVAVECQREGGEAVEVSAQTVVVCAGGVQTPRLLWNSAVGERVPGNHSDWLGRGFMEHPGIQFYGRTRAPLMPGSAAQVHLHVRDNLQQAEGHGLGAGLLHVGLKRGAGGEEFYVAEMLYEQAMEANNRILPGRQRDRLGDPLPRLDYRLSALDARTIAWHRQWQHGLARALGPVDRISGLRPGSHHLLGATRMGMTPDRSVVDTHLRVWEADNLYLASSSVFPTGLSVPPTLVLVALARRLAAHLGGA